MVSPQEVEQQLSRINVKTSGWGRREFEELPNIMLPGEEIYECVNGIYEGGFALLIATDVRVLLVDKKPLNFLTVEDMRFDMISEMDYNHRLLGAFVSISSGNKNLNFRSYNQPRLRKLIGHVQHCMAESKKKHSYHVEGQSQHLERINEQLQSYLAAQQEYQRQMQQFNDAQKAGASPQAMPQMPEPPSNELKDYLYARSLMQQFGGQPKTDNQSQSGPRAGVDESASMDDIYAEARQEVFGKRPAGPPQPAAPAGPSASASDAQPLDINNPLRIACAKLPMALRNRRFGRPSFHDHSRAQRRPKLATYSR